MRAVGPGLARKNTAKSKPEGVRIVCKLGTVKHPHTRPSHATKKCLPTPARDPKQASYEKRTCLLAEEENMSSC